MSTKHFSEGSLWRRWDLHIHAPETKLSDGYTCDGDVWVEYIDQLEKSPVQAFGITDYFSSDGYFAVVDKYNEKYPDTDKVFFPNVEFRLVEAISAENSNPHIHIIFDNDPQHCPKVLIDRFLSTLMTSAESSTGAQVSCAELKTEQDFEAATVSIKDIRDALNKTFGEEEPVWCKYSNELYHTVIKQY